MLPESFLSYYVDKSRMRPLLLICDALASEISIDISVELLTATIFEQILGGLLIDTKGTLVAGHRHMACACGPDLHDARDQSFRVSRVYSIEAECHG